MFESEYNSYDVIRPPDISDDVIRAHDLSCHIKNQSDVSCDTIKQPDDVTTIDDVTKSPDCNVSAVYLNLQKLQERGKLTDVKMICSDGLVLGEHFSFSLILIMTD